PAARIRPTPTQRKPSLSVEPSLVDVSFGQPEAFGHLPGRVLGPHTGIDQGADFAEVVLRGGLDLSGAREHQRQLPAQDRKSTRLNSSHVSISYAVFCL